MLRKIPRPLPSPHRTVGAVLALVASAGFAAAADRLAGPVAGEVLAVVDGDTLRVRAHIWLDLRIEVLVRIRGIDAPELRGRCASEKAMAVAAAARLSEAVGTEPVTLANLEGDKYYGRVVADVFTRGGGAVGPLMLATGLVRAYDGEARGGWCDLAWQGPG